jgi:uroporphyrinogen-III synthase
MSPPESAPGALTGRHVVVTRPAAQAQPFCAMLESAGARVTRFPVIEIQGPNDPGQLAAVLGALEALDIAVFVSANAVQRVLPAVRALGPWPARLKIAAIGARTARELEAHGCRPDIVPESCFDSEALLDERALRDVQGRRVVIFRGDGGREHLAEALRSRGAEVIYAEAYRRAVPALDPAPLRRQLEAGAVDAVTVTSGESLRNLLTMIGPAGRAALLGTPLIAGAGRVAELARELGFRADVATADDPTDAAMFDAVVRLLGACQQRESPDSPARRPEPG